MIRETDRQIPISETCSGGLYGRAISGCISPELWELSLRGRRHGATHEHTRRRQLHEEVFQTVGADKVPEVYAIFSLR